MARLVQECVKLYFALYAESILCFSSDKGFIGTFAHTREREMLIVIVSRCHLLAAIVLMKIFRFIHLLR